MSCYAEYQHAEHLTATGESCSGFAGEYHANSHQTDDAGRVFIGHVCEKGPHLALLGEDGYGECGSRYFAGIYVTVDPNVSRRGDTADARKVAEYLADALQRLDRLETAAAWAEAETADQK